VTFRNAARKTIANQRSHPSTLPFFTDAYHQQSSTMATAGGAANNQGNSDKGLGHMDLILSNTYLATAMAYQATLAQPEYTRRAAQSHEGVTQPQAHSRQRFPEPDLPAPDEYLERSREEE